MLAFIPVSKNERRLATVLLSMLLALVPLKTKFNTSNEHVAFISADALLHVGQHS